MFETLSDEDLTDLYRGVLERLKSKRREYIYICRDLRALYDKRQAIQDELDAREIEHRNSVALERQLRS